MKYIPPNQKGQNFVGVLELHMQGSITEQDELFSTS